MSVLRFLVLRTLEVPIIAAINGAAVGIIFIKGHHHEKIILYLEAYTGNFPGTFSFQRGNLGKSVTP